MLRYSRVMPMLIALSCSACGSSTVTAQPGELKTLEQESQIRATVATPVMSPNGGTMNGPTTVTMTCSTSGASIYYTIDGTTPSQTSRLYTGPFTLMGDTNVTVKAKAFKRRMTASTIASADFTAVPTTPPPPPLPETPWIAGYYVGYQRYLYPESAVDFSNLTHLIVGRVLPRTDGSLNTALDLDTTTGPTVAKRLATLAHQNGKKALIMLGGAGEAANWVGATSPTNRSKFVQNLITLLNDWGYDGLDLDWEPLTTTDYPSMLAIVQMLRQARPDIILSVPVGWINPNYEVVDSFYLTLTDYVDRINIMSYGMAGPWSGWLSWHSAALKGFSNRTPSTIETSVAAYTRTGIPRQKIGVGAGFYGSCWKGSVTGPDQEVTGSNVIAADNTMSYANILSKYYSATAYRYDTAAESPYLTFPNGGGPLACTFVSYEDERSVYAKGQYIRSQGLGGVIIWTLGQGYLPGNTSNTHPLVREIQRGIAGT